MALHLKRLCLADKSSRNEGNTVSEKVVQSKVLTTKLENGALLRVLIDAPPGNVLDSQMTLELIEVFKSVRRDPELKAVVLVGAGQHFCFGASVEEHRPFRVAEMLESFHELFRTILRSGVIVVSAVQGMCLGGGLELVAFSQRIFAHPRAKFGQPEIALGVFAPIASMILGDRLGRSAAEDLLLTGRTVKAQEALAMRLVDAIDEEPESAAVEWIKAALLPHSASSLRFAARAARLDFSNHFDARIAALEKLYLDELMESKDAREGIEAFLEKRTATWSNA